MRRATLPAHAGAEGRSRMTQCPNCGAGLRPDTVRCAKCGSLLRDEPPTPRAPEPTTPIPFVVPEAPPAAAPPPGPRLAAGERRSAVLAAILSFIIPGLGQLYNGQFLKGLVFFLISLAAYCGGGVRFEPRSLGLHFTLGLVVQVIAAVEAFRTASAHNRRIGS